MASELHKKVISRITDEDRSNMLDAIKTISDGKILCDTCAKCRHEADGGDGHPADYCLAGHWHTIGGKYGESQDQGEEPKDWFGCKDYVSRQTQSKMRFCRACHNIERDIKTRVSVTHTCGKSDAEIVEFMDVCKFNRLLNGAIHEARQRVLALGPDWDDDGADPTDELTFNRASDFLRVYSHYIQKTYNKFLLIPDIDILRDGSMSVVWDSELTVIFEKNYSPLSHYYRLQSDTRGSIQTDALQIDDELVGWMSEQLIKK